MVLHVWWEIDRAGVRAAAYEFLKTEPITQEQLAYVGPEILAIIDELRPSLSTP